MALAAWGALALGFGAALLHRLDTEHRYLPRRYSPAGPVEIIGLGGSHARSFHYPSLGPHGYSLGESASDLATAEYNLRMVLTGAREVKLVLLAYSPEILDYDFVLSGHDPAVRASWALNVPFAPSAMSAGEIRDRLFGEVEVLGFGSNLLMSRLARDAAVAPRPCSVPQSPNQRANRFGMAGGYPVTPAPAACLPEFGTADVHATGILKSLRADPGLTAKNLARIERMSELVSAHGGRLVLVRTPTTRFYARSPALKALEARHAGQTEALAARLGVVYLDFRDFFPPGQYERDNRIFLDDNHLTLAGARLFSRALRERLIELDLLAE